MIPLADGKRWKAVLDTVEHAPAHTHGHVRAFQASSGDDTALVILDGPAGRTACVVAVRGALGERDAYSPYGLGGFAGSMPPDLRARWEEVASAERWIATYVLHNPLLGELSSDLESDPGRGIAIGSDVHVIDLRPTEEEILAAMSSRRRSTLRRWDRDPGQVTWDHEEILSFLLANARPFFDSLGAAETYRFSDQTWQMLLDAPTTLAVGVRAEGRVEAAVVVGRAGSLSDYLFGISLPGRNTLTAPLLWEVCKRLRGLGVGSLNLGGGIRSGDGVEEFKRRFGTRRAPLWHVRFVHDPSTYRLLCARSGVTPHFDGFFPPYRLDPR